MVSISLILSKGKSQSQRCDTKRDKPFFDIGVEWILMKAFSKTNWNTLLVSSKLLEKPIDRAKWEVMCYVLRKCAGV